MISAGRLRQIEPKIKIFKSVLKKPFQLVRNINVTPVSIDLEKLVFDKESENEAIKNFFNLILSNQYMQELFSKFQLFFKKQYEREKHTLGTKNAMSDYCFQVIYNERKKANKNTIERLFSDNSDALKDNFTCKEAYLSYKNGYQKLKELFNNAKVFESLKNCFDVLISLCAFPGLYAILNVAIIPGPMDNWNNVAFITIPPIHIVPFEHVLSANFCIYFNAKDNAYSVRWLNECLEFDDIGSNFVELFAHLTGEDYEKNLMHTENIDLIPNPPNRDFLRAGDEFDIRTLFGLDMKKELQLKEKKERDMRAESGPRTIIKEEYV